MITEIKARAKINLSLDVVSKMENGYHEMLMVMESVRLYDRIRIRSRKGQGITLRSNLKYLPCDGRNIAVKAAELFFREAGISGWSLAIDMDKRIPVCAGLGGGSSDGAAVLKALNRMFSGGFTREQLAKMSEELGSDVPYCVMGGTVLASGRGEILKPIAPMVKCPVVICKPPFPISTPALFKRIDDHKIVCRPDTDGLVKAIEAKDLHGVASRMYNVFEDALPDNCGAIFDIKSALIDGGALGAVMSGTGSAVFGIFEDKDAAQRTFEKLRKTWRECYLTDII
jgi:4-diphosphocytidyl-2-C-methyl-D-erythritol kinase